MQFASLFFIALGPLAALADTVAFDQTYDVGSNSLNIVVRKCLPPPTGLQPPTLNIFPGLLQR